MTAAEIAAVDAIVGVLRECNASLAVIEERIGAMTHDLRADRRSVTIRCRRQSEAR